jgi:predicted transcriptional regulator
MHNKRKPPPTKSADRVKDYLEIIEKKEIEAGKAKRYDIYRRAGSEAQTDRDIKYLLETGLIIGNDEEGYKKTNKGNDLLSILKKRELVGILTRELSGKKIKRW